MKYSLFLVTLVLIVSACKKVDLNKLSDTPWNPQLGAPLLNAEFTVGDIISKMDSNGNVGFLNKVVTLSYSTTLDTLSIADMLKIQPIELANKIEFPVDAQFINQTIPVGFSLPPYTSNHTFNFDFGLENQLTKIEFKSGELVLNLKTNIPHGFKFNIEIPTLVKGDKQFTTQVAMPYNNLAENNIQVKVPLAGYTAELGGTINPTGEFKINITSTLIGSGKKVTSVNFIDLNLSIKEFGISYAEGKFGAFSENLQDSVEINLIKNATTSEFGLTNPRVKFSIENSFGFPIEIALNNIKSRDHLTNIISPITINNTIKSKGISNRSDAASIDKILISNSNVIETGYKTLQANGIDQLISSRQKTLYYSVTPSANQSNSSAFITDKSYLVIKATAELPLEGYASNLEINDTLDFKLDNGDLKLDYLEIKLLATNKFPLDVKGSLILLDENKSIIRNEFNQPLDLLKPKNKMKEELTDVLKAGITDGNGTVIEGKNTAFSFVFTNEDINILKRAKYIKIIGKLDAGSSTKPIKLTESNSLKLMLGIKTSVKPSFK